MSSLHVLIGSLGFVLVGAVLQVVLKGDPLASTLILAGIAGLSGSAVAANRQKVKSEKKAQESFEETQQLRRDLHSRD